MLKKSQKELYQEWTASLKAQYTAQRDSLGPLVEGKLFRKGGYLNGFPTWSPDGSRLAYVSNRGFDFGPRMCYIANLAPGGWIWKDKQKAEREAASELEKELKKVKSPEDIPDTIAKFAGAFDIAVGGGIQSAPVWLDEWNILYNRRMPADRHGSHWWDIYRDVINTKDPRKGDHKRITHDLRGTYPDLSPDKRWLVYVKNGAGQNNIWVMDRNDNSRRQLTAYADGTQLYRPRWSPDGKTIAFTIQSQGKVDIALMDQDGGNFRYLVNSDGQDRDPAWTSDGKNLLFSSDISGIPNLYRIRLEDGAVTRLTNVIGGAFSPAVSPADTTVAFSYYGPDGYEIRLLPMNEGTPVAATEFHHDTGDASKSLAAGLSSRESKPYRMKTLDFSLMPRIVNDRGKLKLGLYTLKSEVIDQGNFMFGGDIAPGNKDTDLFALFEYKRLVPTLFVEMYRQTRNVKTNENYMEEYGTIINKRIFDLNEIDFGARYTPP